MSTSSAHPPESPHTEFLLGGRRVQPGLNRVLDADGTRHQVEPKAMQVLLCLLLARGEVVTREEVIERVWEGGFVTDDVLTRSIGQLRRLFDDDPEQPRVIETIRKRGYRLLVPAEPATGPIAAPDPAPASPPERAAAAFPAERPGAPHTNPARAWLFPLALLLLVGIAAGAFWKRSSPPDGPGPSLVSVPVGGGGAELRRPRISPDGTRIAYAAEPAPHALSIWTVLLAGGSPLRLTSAEGAVDVPGAWSPDGSELAFTRRLRGLCEIRIVPALGGAERRVAPCGDREAIDLAWSPDGTALLFATATDGGAGRALRRLVLATGEIATLTRPPDGWLGDDAPAISPDGRTIAFVRSIAPDVDDVWVMPAGGGEPRRLTFDHATVIGVDWLSDGDTLVFSSSRAGLNSLWGVSARGGEPVFLAGAGPKIKHPSAARTVSRVVFESWEFEINLERARADGTGCAIAPGPDWSYQPRYSPDGSRIAFVSTRAGSPQVWVVDRDGNRLLQLTNGKLGQVATPSWSPDGSSLVFVGRPQGEADLYVVDAGGAGGARRITRTAGDEVVPSWSRDGAWIYFAARAGGAWQVSRIRVADGATERVTSDGGFAARESVDGKSLYFTRADRPGLYSMPLPPASGATETALPRLLPADAQAWDVGALGPYVAASEGDADLERVRYYIHGAKEQPEIAALRDLAWKGFTVSPDGQDLVYARLARHVCRFVRLDHPRLD